MIELSGWLDRVEQALFRGLTGGPGSGPKGGPALGAWIDAGAVDRRTSMRRPQGGPVRRRDLERSLEAVLALDRRCCAQLGAEAGDLGVVLVSREVGVPGARCFTWSARSGSLRPAPAEHVRTTLQPLWDRASALVVFRGRVAPTPGGCDYGPLLVRGGLAAAALQLRLTAAGVASCLVGGVCPPGAADAAERTELELDLIAVAVGGGP